MRSRSVARMDHYHIWVDLREGVRDMHFVDAVHTYFAYLTREGLIESGSLARRKLGLGPEGLGEWHIDITTRDLAQLDAAFQRAATRTGEVERVHAAVYACVTGFKAALYRDFPDAARVH